MDFSKAKKLLRVLTLIYFLLAAMIFFVTGDGFRYEIVNGNMLSQTSVIGEIVDGMVVEQRLPVGADHAEAVNIMVATFGRANTGILHVDICGEDGRTLASVQGRIEDMVDNHVMRFEIPNGIADLRQENVALRIWSEGCHPGNAITLYYGNSVRSGRFDVQKQISDEDLYRINGIPGNGSLCAYFNGYNDLIAYKLYWPLIILIFAVTAIIFRIWWKQAEQGKWNPLTMLCSMVFKYGFLTRQLVSRDFKTKYKRSVLGVGWSILNPLLTMLVQYVVFSTLFSNGTKNYPVYLLTGIVFFSFFSEAINMGMSSITSNAALIKKVYVPKYIFPVSRVLSSLINLGTSMIPLLAVMLLTGTWPKLSILLLVFDILCLIVFVMGMSLLLSTCMTFFQDTQFLWGVVSMIWMYLTPIFYMDTIIPEKFLGVYHMNPMYQYINFARTCIIEGVSPSPISYLWCILAALVAFIAGTAVFRKNQDRFVMYL